MATPAGEAHQRRTGTRRPRGASALALPLLLATGSLAAAQTPLQPQTVGAPAEPAAAAHDASTGGDILVTARRREEQVQDVPLAISVINAAAVEQTGSYNLNRLQQLQPTLQFYSSNPRNSSINIRGLGAPLGLTNDGIEQGVGLYIDQVYYNRVAAATLDFVDIERIEVLRGPQGTLYGKNTTAGAINVTTRAPSFDFEGVAEVTVGNYNFKQAKASASGPLTDRVAVRLGVSTTDRRGTIYDVATGQHVNGQDNLGLRGTLLWNATDTLRLFLSGDYNVQDPNCCVQIYARVGSTQRAAARQYAGLIALFPGYSTPSTDPFDRVTDLDAALRARNEMGGASLRGELDLGKGTLTSVTAYRYWDWKPRNDRDFTGLPITIASNNPTQQKQYTQELRYAQSSDKIDFVVGAFGFYQEIRTQGLTVQGSAASRWFLTGALRDDPSVLNGLTANNDIRLDNTSLAAFGQFTWHVTDRLSVQPGVRINYDKKKGSYDSVVTNGGGQLVTFTSSDPRVVAQRGVLAPQSFRANFSDTKLSYDFTASYKIAEDVLAYGTYARAIKSGGLNLNGVPLDTAGRPQLEVAEVAPEKVDHFEVGLKTQFWNRRATLNLTGFWTTIRDYQAVVNNGQNSVLRGYLANADKVRTRGVEAEFSVRPSARLNGYFSGAYTDAYYVRFPNAPCPPELSGGGTGLPIGASGVPGTNSPLVCDISGQWLPGISKWSLSYGAEVNLPATIFGGAGQVYAGVDGSYRSKFSSNASRSIYTDVAGYSVNNLRAGFRNDRGFNIFGWVRNLFDEDYFEQLATTPNNTGLIVGQPADPRTYGLTIRSAF